MRKEATVHMLHSDNPNPNLFYHNPIGGKKVLSTDQGKVYHKECVESGLSIPQHLYFTTDEEIKEDESCIFNNGVSGDSLIHQYNGKGDKRWFRKIVATTNPEMHCIGLRREGASCSKNNKCTFPNCGVARIPQLFIKQYIDNQGSIKKVMLEYDETTTTYPSGTNIQLQLNLNSSGEVSVHPVHPLSERMEEFFKNADPQDVIKKWESIGYKFVPIDQKMYTRDEVLDILDTWRVKHNIRTDSIRLGEMKEWFNKNYPI